MIDLRKLATGYGWEKIPNNVRVAMLEADTCIEELEAQREELLGALRAAAEELDDYSPLTGNTIETSASRAARAAIAKAKEST